MFRSFNAQRHQVEPECPSTDATYSMWKFTGQINQLSCIVSVEVRVYYCYYVCNTIGISRSRGSVTGTNIIEWICLMCFCLQGSPEIDKSLDTCTAKPPLGFHFCCTSVGNASRLAWSYTCSYDKWHHLSQSHDTETCNIKNRAINQQTGLEMANRQMHFLYLKYLSK